MGKGNGREPLKWHTVRVSDEHWAVCERIARADDREIAAVVRILLERAIKSPPPQWTDLVKDDLRRWAQSLGLTVEQLCAPPATQGLDLLCCRARALRHELDEVTAQIAALVGEAKP